MLYNSLMSKSQQEERICEIHRRIRAQTNETLQEKTVWDINFELESNTFPDFKELSPENISSYLSADQVQICESGKITDSSLDHDFTFILHKKGLCAPAMSM